MRKLLYLVPFLLLLFLAKEMLLDQKMNPEFRDCKYQDKHLPYDLFFLKNYPDFQPNIQVYERALANAKEEEAQRSPVNFNAAWELQGPTNGGARVNTIVIHPENDDIILAGFSSGGIWKTINGGTSWYPVFEDKPYLAISHISFDPGNPDILYAGTGDRNVTGYPFIGDGAHKSTDLGETWVHIGLTEQRIVSKIEVAPGTSDTIYAACMGLPFERNNQRGLYKSVNGGTTWQQVLFLSDSAGIIDFCIHPENPDIVYASGWNRIRNNHESIVTGDDARILKTTDGGQNWTHLSNGLPSGELGRVNLAMSKTNPDKLYAIFVSTGHRVHGIYQTLDGGNSWTTQVTGENNGLSNPLGAMGWYFSRIFVNPSNDNELFLLGVRVWRSVNSGVSWSMYTPLSSGPGTPHVDNHELVFTSNGNIMLGTDGGIYVEDPLTSFWTDIEDIPATQFYRTGYNPHFPDIYYGGAQDNGTLAGNADSLNGWEQLYGLDGFKPVFNPGDPDVFYVESQRGNIWKTTNGGNGFSSLNAGLPSADQRHWDMPYLLSAFDNDLLYAGTYRMYKNDGNPLGGWQLISPQLTDDIVFSAGFHTITAIDESTIDSLVLYAGTTDANVWRTLDGGTNWINITTGLPERYVSAIKASPDNVEKVYVTHTGYKDNDNTARIHRSDDNGDNWISISNNLPALAVNDILIIPGTGDQQLFAATDAGVYGSTNAGLTWERVGTNMPIIAVYHLVWNEEKNEVVAATFGRSIQSYPLDSLIYNNETLSVGGNIQTENGGVVDGVMVRLDVNENATSTILTGSNFIYPGLNSGDSICISPTKDTLWTNGLTTLDLVLIQRHILGLSSLDSPFKIIAADANGSNSVTTLDVVFLRKLILGISSAVEGNTSWRFIPDNHIFPEPEMPFLTSFTEKRVISNLISDVLDENFIAVKTGDVNNSAGP